MKGSIADVCIVGVGAVGGILAKQLTSAGLKVVAFERGPALKTAEYAQRDSIRYIARPDQLEGVRHEPRIFRTRATQSGNLRYGTSPFNVLGGSMRCTCCGFLRILSVVVARPVRGRCRTFPA